ncbi:glutathione S-transferase family protein [Mesorhizobium sp. B1-1-8]|uniref:glutathione S-transferase family protein n=1 Tax=Mesorhizobium sp. B1-1-8 TaxID=2589976 RepID=UPI001129AD65|nr:glutathione S-transferase family protein [Mesorhizobium sp. B1-1-8]UCI07198.1 glutathione S-transferase family protein [Mesorhizobium sp. B1-1-8]
MSIRISAFAWVPPVAQGLVRDLRVRWALEEAGLGYEERRLKLGDNAAPEYLALQPFGQIPAYEEDGLALFESGSIVLHIAERCETLLPSDPKGGARTKTWMFAALNTVEPPVLFLNQLQQMNSPEAAALQKPVAEAVQRRLDGVASRLSNRDYLEEDQFTAGDLLMTTVLRILRNTDLVSDMPVLVAYQSRCEARPAFQRALSAQMATFHRNDPARQPSA